ncbi:LysR substrate-binding domain-containing protein [Amphritea japonica]|uniref:LysR family transcriptional regulator, glycine cleavage system transcriptional activator n=1 Tax=Amphritea japonica ATCC BAA-1530 TaxID=1278309 RepID=A0A7R6STQ2_9GAMM|nr:LysR substrate-binding domain-containing protein [Amphritea japonica]BBB26940.1 LysR family transcriptional regulator, glycine cleavage system transcriptional activator [Amphritea japonica ATCC BAA-1530]
MAYIPLMNALKTFVVAGKYLNFTKAAEELLVSPSAVSHQIKTLEEYLEVRLFSRTSRSMLLTDEGYRLYTSLDEPFKAIASAVRNVMEVKQQANLHIALRPFFSVSWLAPRLKNFWVKNSEIQVDLIHRNSAPDFSAENIDAAILWGKGEWPGAEAQRLIPGELTPVCSPAFLQEAGRILHPEDLAGHTFIHDTDYAPWREWLDLAGAEQVRCESGLIFDDTNVRLQAILNGQGIMLGCPLLLQRELQEGSLVRLFDLELPDYAYYIAWPDYKEPDRKTAAFIDWISKEAEQWVKQ